MTSTVDNYFLNYHELVLARITSGQTKLYPHQIQALLAIYQKACKGELDGSYRQAALILAGVGTGKTLIQAIAPYILAPWMSGKQALFLSDNCTLRARFLKDFPTDSLHRPIYQEWLLYSLGVLPPGVPPPQIVELDATDFNSYAYAMHSSDMLVGNRQFVLNLVQRGDIEPAQLGVVVIDEAHFSAANSYNTITNYFSQSLLCYFTGSKFRSDSQPLPNVRYEEIEELDELGRSVLHYSPVADYEFTLQDAWRLNPSPIKKLTYKEATSAAFLIEEEGIEVEYDPIEFILKAQTDRQWFRQILFADSFSLPVLEMAVQVLLGKRSTTGQPHAMLVRALNIPHVHRVAKLLEDNFPMLEGKVLAIHSEHEQYDLAGRASTLLEEFYSDRYLVIVHCGMLGVGFDHKWVSVSCCLCVLKSMSPAEQEWGRALRKVPGASPGLFPEINHPNWAVVVTHSALELRELFEKFLQGVGADTIKDAPTEKQIRPILTTAYEAGETVLTLSNTLKVKPGDVLELRVPALVVDEALAPKFSLIEELRSTGSLSEETNPQINQNGSAEGTTVTKNNLFSPLAEPKQTTLPWQAEVEAIASSLHEIRGARTYQVKVEAVLDHKNVQITPAWNDIPSGVEVKLTNRSLREVPDANFLQHVGLDWQILVDNKLVSYLDYKKQVVLQQRGMNLDDLGEIVVGGVRLRDTLPPQAYELFLKGLEAELATAEVEIPQSDRVARPDKAKLEMQARYGALVRGLVNDVFKQRNLVKDGTSGRSLVENPVSLLQDAITRVQQKGHEPNFANNSALIHAAVFGYIKEQTKRGWSQHTTDAEYQEAVKIARQFFLRLREQLQWRPLR
ncbi:MAG: DEAD/DEAH box helicase family protein [Gloeocapsa sp. UFS-A4-WI-NPMV-4B04]|jgi:hypothetical protein|nr:DEAD/DEAH box helicase family protein [Gloeocapsa sp. UFS-A4-WI-NPMV-4B04]